MKQTQLTIKENKKIAANTFRLMLCGDCSAMRGAGQFINILIPGKFLRRPLSVCDYTADSLCIIYKTVGEGTQILSRLQSGETIDALVGLGNGFDLTKNCSKPLLIGGGVGVPPLYKAAKDLIAAGKSVSVILGFNTSDEIFYTEEFEALGCRVFLTTADGSAGTKGFVSDVMDAIDYDYFYACGPKPMFEAIEKKAHTGGQYSFEERMGCGFGACMGCTCKTEHGNKRICKEGPVLEREEILW
ncbi:MAG: dihydroorotate dehydrogenase electron transfer subunit [Clostridia bacterium]|nr:dihydroorotate dehydrogenase electron transfer subunit [Clostridia bacterium]